MRNKLSVLAIALFVLMIVSASGVMGAATATPSS